MIPRFAALERWNGKWMPVQNVSASLLHRADCLFCSCCSSSYSRSQVLHYVDLRYVLRGIAPKPAPTPCWCGPWGLESWTDQRLFELQN